MFTNKYYYYVCLFLNECIYNNLILLPTCGCREVGGLPSDKTEEQIFSVGSLLPMTYLHGLESIDTMNCQDLRAGPRERVKRMRQYMTDEMLKKQSRLMRVFTKNLGKCL